MRTLTLTFILGILFTLAAPPSAEARDIYTRIDECESDDGGDCIFDILRELAGRGDRGGNGGNGGNGWRGRNEFCECRQIEFEPEQPYNCWSTATWAAMRIVVINDEERPQRISLNEWTTRACRGQLNDRHEAPQGCLGEAIEACRR